MTIAEYGRPIKIFYANLLHMGVTLRVDGSSRSGASAHGGKLLVDGNLANLSPAYREEIVKRAHHLRRLLTPPPAELVPYFGRLLLLDELNAALMWAEGLGATVDATPVNGGWLLLMAKELPR